MTSIVSNDTKRFFSLVARILFNTLEISILLCFLQHISGEFESINEDGLSPEFLLVESTVETWFEEAKFLVSKSKFFVAPSFDHDRSGAVFVQFNKLRILGGHQQEAENYHEEKDANLLRVHRVEVCFGCIASFVLPTNLAVF